MQCNIKSEGFNAPEFIGFFAIALVLLVGVQLLFVAIQEAQAERTQKSLHSIFRNELNMQEPYRLAQGVSDLESLGLFRCSVLKEDSSGQIFQDLQFRSEPTSCKSDMFNLNGAEVTSKLLGVNGRSWTISFITSNGESFYASLWIARVTVLVLAIASIAILHFRRRSLAIKVEVELRQAQAIKDISFQLAHDIRAPVGALRTAIAMTSGGQGARVIIDNALKRIESVSENLLDGFRSEVEKVEGPTANNSAERKSFFELIDTVIEERRLCLEQETGCQITFSTESHLKGCEVAFDGQKIAQVLSNLINNAVDATHGSFDKKVQIRYTLNGTRIRIDIEDSGCGMSDELLEKIGHRRFSSKKDGNGFGLLYAKKIISDAGGTLQFHSELGRGTRVRIELPCVRSIEKDVVLIDDAPELLKIWTMAAKRGDLKLWAFSCLEDFYSSASLISSEASVFVDVDLGASRDGATQSKDIAELGFNNIWLTTGYPAEKFGNWRVSMPWLKGIRDKTPPWIVQSTV